MKSKRYFPHAATVFFVLTVAVALFSWIGSVYGLGEVQSLLSAEGIRWELRHTVANYVQAPALGIVMILFIGLGIVWHSGIWNTLGRTVKRGMHVSHKERRALVLAGCTLLAYALLVAGAAFMPGTMLRSVIGTLGNSPLLEGIYYIVSLGVGLSGVVFGYASDRFRNDRDIVRGMSCLFSRFADYFVVLFFIVQFFASLEYTRLAEWAGIDSQLVRYAFHVCCFLPFVWMIGRKR